MEKYEDEKSGIIRESVGEAILKLLQIRAFDDISVCDICRKAGVGRTTYYRYYGNKNGKEDAVYHWFINRWEDSTEHRELSLSDTDEAFLSFVYSVRHELRLLRDNRLIHILDSFILHIYGPTGEEAANTGLYYVKYAGAGLWMGAIRAILYRDFGDSKEEMKQQFQEALACLKSI